MPAVHVRPDELAACGRDLAEGARRVAEASGAFDRRSADGLALEHPIAIEAYERFFCAWSLRLRDVVAALEDGADTVLIAAARYTSWERYVAELAR